MFFIKRPTHNLNLSTVLQFVKLKPARNFPRTKTSYVVLLPEVPEDTSSNNPLLSLEDLPNFEELSSEKCFTGIGKHCLQYETGVWAIEEKLKEKTHSNSFENVILELEKLDSPLTFAWSTVKTLYSVKNDVISTGTYLKIHERARKARVHKFQSRPIYEACKEIYAKDTRLDEAQKRVIRKFLLEARLNGVELTAKQSESLNEVLKKLENQKSLYRKKLQEASRKFSYRIIDEEIVRDFPPSLLKVMAYNSEEHLKGPWTVTHHPLVYKKFLEYCPHKDLRWNAWRAYVMRCSIHLSRDFNNAVHVEEIRSFRREQAKILGFKTFADMSMETKMAGSVDDVLSVITSLFAKAKEKQIEEIKTLQEFAQNRGFESDLEECDIPYWRRKRLIHVSKSKEMELEKFFPLEHVWSQLLALCSNLFGVHFEEVAPGTIRTWHPDVRFYNVLDSDGRKISSFYFDPFRRPNEKLETQNNSAWMLVLKTRCNITETLPVASLIFNFPRSSPEDGPDSLLSFEDVQAMFKKFGHALQHLLTTVPYGQASGLTNIEWDAVEVCSNFLLNWLYEPSVLEKVSKNCETGEPLNRSEISSLLTRRTHMAAYDLCHELFLSHLDIKLHTEETHWFDIMKELWPLYMPFEMDKKSALPCWFSPIMSDVWAAAYYSHTWAKMLSADAFRAFKECEPHEVTDVGRRFRETFLSLGGGAHPAQVFRQFRGRDPTPEALHTLLQIT